MDLESLKEQISSIKSELIDHQVTNNDHLEEFRLKYISPKGTIGALFQNIKSIPPEDRREYGNLLNDLKAVAKENFERHISTLENSSSEDTNSSDIDITLPPLVRRGAEHPLSIVKNKILDIFQSIGFSLSTGPEIEDDWHNFSALNIPQDHPAREMQDTFFIDEKYLLRTQTSNIQIRTMQRTKPPIRTLSFGRAYRNEAISARAHCMFHQVEGLYVDTDVSFKDLKQTLYHFVQQLFGEETKIRFRPSFFPFTEPSAEIDISCLICSGEGCKVCKHTGWVELGGTGMVDPNVFENCDIDPNKYSGFAFGMGVERITMLLYRIDDLRLFTENNIRFSSQFK